MERYIFDKRNIKWFLIHFGIMLLIALPLAVVVALLLPASMHNALQIFIIVLVVAGEIMLEELVYNIFKEKKKEQVTTIRKKK